MCPQARRPGEAHWFSPMTDKNDGTFSAMLDTDVSMTVSGDYFAVIKQYAADEAAFLCNFGRAFLTTTELGHGVQGGTGGEQLIAAADFKEGGEGVSDKVGARSSQGGGGHNPLPLYKHYHTTSRYICTHHTTIRPLAIFGNTYH